MTTSAFLASFAEDIIQDPVFIVDNKGKLVFANEWARAAMKASRLTSKAYIARLQEELALRAVFEERDIAPLQLRKVVIAGNTYSVTGVLRDKFLVLSLRDISDIRSMAASYSSYAERYLNMSRALHHLPQGIFITDPWGIVLYGNEAAAACFGLDSASGLTGQRSGALSPLFTEFVESREEERIVARAEISGGKDFPAKAPPFVRVRSVPLVSFGKRRGNMFLLEPFMPGPSAENRGGAEAPPAAVKSSGPAKNAQANAPRYTLADFVGQSKSVLKLKEVVRKVARTSSTVLIQSESGTGKELLAHALHSLSSRGAMPFVKLNCASIPETLLESEIFGYEPGAFTGAKKDGHAGRFEQADGGTIFLDEIGEMPVPLQAKLLRVIQEREVQRLGGGSTRKLDVRIVCATNNNLLARIGQQLFRSDLYYRLNVVALTIPPLRERKEDIKSLVIYFLRKNSQMFQKYVKGISRSVYATFMYYDWPGNVRELGNVIEYAFNVVEGDVIEMEHLPDYLLLLEGGHPRENSKLSVLLDEYGAKVVRNVLDRHNGNKVEAAKELGISRATLYRILAAG